MKRKFAVVLLVLIVVSGSIPAIVDASDCTQDTLIDKFGDWFGNFGKKEGTKRRNIAVRKANKAAECAEKESRKAVR